jgi:hypothetical protein
MVINNFTPLFIMDGGFLFVYHMPVTVPKSPTPFFYFDLFSYLCNVRMGIIYF